MAKRKSKVKKPITCGHKHKTICDKHEKPCTIVIEYPEGDERNEWAKHLAEELGAPRHTEESEHRCETCMAERFEHSPHQTLPVEGLNALQQARLRRSSGQFILRPPPKESDDGDEHR